MKRCTRRRMRPAFVLTLVALVPAGCKKSERSPQAEETAPVTAASSSSPAPVASVDPRKLKRRSVRSSLPKAKPSKIEIAWGSAERLNAQDSRGAWIYAGAEGSCYTGAPREEHSSNPPGVAAGTQQPIDCPDAMLDPAWDTCLDAQLIRPVRGKDECVCDRHGNPPPPVTTAECPKPSR